MATWEDEQAIKEEFPAAPGWGQASSHQGGDVNNPMAGTHNNLGQEEGTDHNGPGGSSEVRPKPRRSVKPNVKYFKSEWVRACVSLLVIYVSWNGRRRWREL